MSPTQSLKFTVLVALFMGSVGSDARLPGFILSASDSYGISSRSL